MSHPDNILHTKIGNNFKVFVFLTYFTFYYCTLPDSILIIPKKNRCLLSVDIWKMIYQERKEKYMYRSISNVALLRFNMYFCKCKYCFYT